MFNPEGIQMKAIVYEKYGPPEVLQLKEVAKPTPKANEVLINVYATTVYFGDLLARKFNTVSPRQFNMPAILWLPSRLAFGLRKPRISVLGSEFAGVIEAVGKDVTLFHKGDLVFGYRGASGTVGEPL
jgi:NADPH:quinone reductase-like Zn-dependent oxidoreductase